MSGFQISSEQAPQQQLHNRFRLSASFCEGYAACASREIPSRVTAGIHTPAAGSPLPLAQLPQVAVDVIHIAPDLGHHLQGHTTTETDTWGSSTGRVEPGQLP
jgi:hypothetical protein